MNAFLCADIIPVTIKAERHLRYEAEIRVAFRQYWPHQTILTGRLYGVVYYFHKVPTQIDADNLSKPVFDALKNELYKDDRSVEVVRSGNFDLGAFGTDELDLTRVPDNVVSDFLQALDHSDHILYIEIGSLDFGMFEFGCES